MKRSILPGLLLWLLASAATPAPALAQAPQVDAGRTREELRELLRRHPSEVGTVLAMSPSLLRNEAFLASYPALQGFLAEHPEVVSDPGFFFSGSMPEPVYVDSRSPTMIFWQHFVEMFAVILGFAMGALLFAWLVKTLLEQRRWSRLAKVQAEVHGKVLDRLATNEQLLAYMETPAGRRFLESAPIPLESPRPAGVAAPFGRVLWSLQVGLVLAAAGIGLMIVSVQMPEGGELPLRVLGVALLSIGIGFVVASGASVFVARRLGLWQEPAPASQE